MSIQEVKNRPSWDVYFMCIAYIVASKSIDPSTKCGSVIVSKDKRILSTGYNGPIRNSIDEKIPLTRPEKYEWFLHSEINAILAYNGSLSDIDGASIYVTSMPCHNCMKSLIQKGIKRIVFCNNKIAHCVCESDQAVSNAMIESHSILIGIIDKKEVFDLLGLITQNINLGGM